MESIVLTVEPRICKKNEAKKLRKEGKVPAVLYHQGEETSHISVSELSLDKLIHTSGTNIVDLRFPDGKTKRSYLKDIQFDSLTDKAIHADFQYFSAGEVLEIEVSTQFIGESPGVVAGGKMQVIQHSLKLKGVPSKLPEHVAIDISGLEMGQTLHIGEIPADVYEGRFEIVGDPESPVVSILSPKVESEAPESVEETDTEEAVPETE